MTKKILLNKIKPYLDNDNFPEIIRKVIQSSLEDEKNINNLKDILTFFKYNEKLIKKLK